MNASHRHTVILPRVVSSRARSVSRKEKRDMIRNAGLTACEKLESRTLLSSVVPAGWTDLDIGSPSLAGSANYTAATGAWSVAGCGKDIWNASDQFNFASEHFNGNGTLIAKVNSVTNTYSWAKAGLMFRASTAAGAQFADVVITPSQGVNFQWRTATNGSCGTARIAGVVVPKWLELTRNGNSFSAFYSSDGTTWKQIGVSETVALPTAALAGLAVTSVSPSQLNTSTFSNVNFTNASSTAPTIATPAAANPNPTTGLTTNLSVLGADAAGESALTYTWSTVGTEPGTVAFSANKSNAAKLTTATFSVSGSYALQVTVTNASGLSVTSAVTVTVAAAGALPAGWSNANIGSPALAGSASYSGGNWTLTGAGADISGTADQLDLASKSFTGDGVFIAQVTGVTNTNSLAKAGVMFRASTAAGAMFADVVITPGGGAIFQWRAATNEAVAQTVVAGVVAPQWVELIRAGNKFFAYYSSDGSTWTQIGTSQTVAMSSAALAGLIVTSHNTAARSTATFSNVSLAANTAPKITVAAAANLNSAAFTAALSVLGSDDGGQANLTYTWSVVGTPPKPVTFSVNGSNTAQNTLATFTAGGNYTLQVKITDTAGLSVTSTVTISLLPAPAGVSAIWSGTAVAVSWQPVSGAVTYNVYRATTPGGEGATPIATGITTASYTDKNVTAGQQYFYQVTGVGSSASLESARSAEVASLTPGKTPFISELLAVNTKTLADSSGNFNDWVEVYNPTSASVSLAGYYLTDKTSDLAEWQIPAVTIASGKSLVIFCDGTNLTDPTKQLHTNFSLSGSGEYLALVASDGKTVLSSYTFPQQLPDISYGVAMSQPNGAVGYLKPTPGAVNGQLIAQTIVAEPTFDHAAGFYTSSFQLAISDATPGAQIRYTLDGTAPTATTGTVYTTPLTISGESNVRAIAYESGALPSFVNTASYIYTSQVITQSADGKAPPGWPTTWGPHSPVNYGMDPRVVNDPAYSGEIKQDLLDLPTFSITMNLNDLFSPTTGIYYNSNQSGSAWERPASVEMINPGGARGFQINAGLRIKGGSSASHVDPKHGFRVIFDSSYGSSSLDYPLFGANAAQSFKEIDLRTDQENSYNYTGGQFYSGLRDEFNNLTVANEGEPATHSQICFLYINGQFWGLYDAIERPNAEFAASYFGGVASDYDVIKDGGVAGSNNQFHATDGTLDAWAQLYTDATTLDLSKNSNYEMIQGNNSDGTPNPAYKNLIDVKNLAQFMLENYYTGNLDGPFINVNGVDHVNNYYAIRPKDGSFGFRFIVTDAEQSLGLNTINNVNAFTNTPTFATDNPAVLFQKLEANANFKLLVADCVQKDFFNNGPMTPAVAIANFKSLASQVYGPVVAESARWGDTLRPSQPYTRNNEWLPEVNRIETNYLPQRTGIVLTQLKNAGLFPSTAAPNFSQYGGVIPSGFQLTISNPASTGKIYYTLDGSDPRLLDGTLSPSALVYSGPIILKGTTEVKSRILNGTAWSPATDYTFATQATTVRITELNYDPPKDPAGTYNNDDYEFVELKNFGTQPVNLKDVAFTDGISYTFGDVTLAAGQVGVLVHNQAAFESRYGIGLNILGSYQASGQSFSNSGEHVRLVDASGQVLEDFTYSPTWYPNTQANGPSLDVINPASFPDLNNAANWRASAVIDGTPGVDDTIRSAAPTGLKAVAAAEQIALSWNPVAGASSYNVYRATAPGGEGAVPFVTGLASSTFTDKGLTDGTPYYYTITAVDFGGESLASGEMGATPIAPLVPAPTYSQNGGIIPSGFNLTLANPATTGTIYYTLDGSDPQALNGTVSPTALAYTGPIPLAGKTEVKSRILNAAAWSPVQDYTFATQATSVRITELDYDPSTPPAGSADTTNDDYEFVELKNFGAQPVNLKDVAFTDGINYTFGDVTLAPGQVGVLVKNQAAFESRYGTGVNLLGSYQASGESFKNSGEHVALVDASGQVLEDFTYSTWYPSTHGDGPSLDVINPSSFPDLNNSANWQPSAVVDGTPGIDDTIPAAAPTGLKATAGAEQIVLTWDPTPGAASYNVYHSTVAGGEGAVPFVTGLTSPTFTDMGLTDGQPYYYIVTAVDFGGESLATGEISATPTV